MERGEVGTDQSPAMRRTDQIDVGAMMNLRHVVIPLDVVGQGIQTVGIKTGVFLVLPTDQVMLMHRVVNPFGGLLSDFAPQVLGRWRGNAPRRLQSEHFSYAETTTCGRSDSAPDSRCNDGSGCRVGSSDFPGGCASVCGFALWPSGLPEEAEDDSQNRRYN